MADEWIAVVSWSSYDSGGAYVFRAHAESADEAAKLLAPMVLDAHGADDVEMFCRVAEVGSIDMLNGRVVELLNERYRKRAELAAAATERRERAQLARLAAKYGGGDTRETT